MGSTGRKARKRTILSKLARVQAPSHHDWTTLKRQSTISPFDERPVLQAVSTTSFPGRFHYPELESAREEGRAQDGFQSAPHYRGIRPWGRRPFPGDRPPDVAGFAAAPVRIG